ALGQKIALGDEKDDAQLFTVVGVVGAVKQAALTEAQGQGAVYLPYASDRDEHASIFVVTRTSQRPEAFAETLRKLVHAAHPLLAVDNIRSMDTRIADSLIGAWLAGRAMQSVLFDVPTLHIVTLLGTAFVMTAVSLIACLIPARRATNVDPVQALRAE